MLRLLATMIGAIAASNLLLHSIQFFLRITPDLFLPCRVFILALYALPTCRHRNIRGDMPIFLVHHQPIRVSSLLVHVWLLETYPTGGNHPILFIRVASCALLSLICFTSAVMKALEQLVVMDKIWLSSFDTSTIMET